ncbi:hypothetical protein CCACVL1_08469, partial [Corchorus capsularis]
MEENLEALCGEKKHLVEGNESLMTTNGLMNQNLESNAKEMEQLRNDFSKMKIECEKQRMLAELLSSKLIGNPDPHLENKRLKDENARILRRRAGGINIDNSSSVVVQLVKENAQLQHENK